MNKEFNFNLIEKVLFLLNEKWRYKVVFGGRGCLDGDSLLDTPNGKIKVKDFSGGKVFSFDGKNIISVFAEKPVVYSKEKLFKLETENNSIITTEAHRFLTPAGWKRLDEINVGDYVFSIDSSFFQKESCDHFQKHYEECQLMCLLNVRRCFYKLLNCLYHCWQGFHQYDEQPLSEVKTYQDVLQQLACELPHKSRVLSQKGDLDIFCINDLTYQFLYHLSNLAFVQDEEGKSSVKQGNCICEKSSELLSVSYQLYQLFDEKKDLVLLVQELSKQLLSVYNLLGQDENLKKVFDILLCEFENNPYSDSLNNCIHDHHYNIFFEKVKQIKYEKTDVFYDLFIPVYNCYFANGILHHNSGKSYAFADCCIIKSLEKPIRILCARQLQNSIRDSVHKLLCDRIEALKLNSYFYITRESIKGLNGSEFIFKGIQNNVNEIKSMEGIDICWIEEAQAVSNESWEILIPTIRKEDSEIWISFNPDREDDSTYKKFVKNPPENCKSVLLNYTDNPYFPDVLKKEMEYCKKVDFEKYEHIWLGKTILQTEAQIFRGKYELKDFETREEERFFFGADWGFACVKGDTLVSTIKGYIPIKEIQVGDMVLTREGYKKVIHTKNKGLKDVYVVDFGCKNSIIATGDHRVFTSNGWKRVDELEEIEELCVIKLNLMAKFIKGIQRANIPIISIINGKKMGNIIKKFCIEIFGNIIKEIFQMVMLYTTKTVIHLIIVLKIFCVLLQKNIQKYIIKIISAVYQKKEQKTLGQKTDIQKKTGLKEEKNQLQQFNLKEEYAKNVENALLSLMFIKNSVVQSVEKNVIQGIVKWSMYVKSVVKDLWQRLINSGKPVQKNVLIKRQLLKEKEEVFDITVENGEFFANGVLVHNCDPIALTRCFVRDNCLYIDYEAGGVGVDFDEIPQLFDSIPDVRKWEIKADSARPETISYVKQKGFNIISCPKWKGSVEDGIGYLRSFEKIYIHPRCKNTYKEFQLYSYKTDKNSGEVLPIILDKDNHYIDSLRYALNSYIQKNVSILDVIDD